jgi:4'-phosphopantetheinyl transferase
METNDQQWQRSIPGGLIHPNEVQVWRAFLDLSKPPKESLLGTLSADELSRASRFRFEKDERRFIAARGILRQILGAYLQKPPHTLQFQYSSNGKPILANTSGDDSLQFNLSHSDDVVLYAFTRNRNIGIDLERIQADVEVEQIASGFFAEAELNAIEQVPESKRNELFFQYWTRKEALIKATGEGLSFPIETFDVSGFDGSILSPIFLPSDNGERPRWYVQDLLLGPGYTAAIVVEGGDCNFSCFEYPG